MEFLFLTAWIMFWLLLAAFSGYEVYRALSTDEVRWYNPVVFDKKSKHPIQYWITAAVYLFLMAFSLLAVWAVVATRFL